MQQVCSGVCVDSAEVCSDGCALAADGVWTTLNCLEAADFCVPFRQGSVQAICPIRPHRRPVVRIRQTLSVQAVCFQPAQALLPLHPKS